MDIILLFWIIVLAALAALVWLFRSRSRAALSIVIVLALAALGWSALLSWVLRDGLGPDAVTSTGVNAWKRFAPEMLFPTSVCGFIIISAVVSFWWRRNGLTRRCS